MKKRLILHIGTHKTASSSIQAFFERGRSENLTKLKLYYPLTTKAPPSSTERPKQKKLNHFSLFAAIRDAIKPTRHLQPHSHVGIIKTLTKEILESGADIAFVSSEELSRPIRQIATECAAFSAHFEVSVLILLRRQDLFAESLYSQFVREAIRSETRTITDFVESPRIAAWLDYATILQPWEAAFGRNAIKILLFEPSTLKAGLINSIFKTCAIPGGGGFIDPTHNVSPGREYVEIMRRINHCIRSEKIPRNAKLAKQKKIIMQILRDLQIGSDSTSILGRPARRRLLEKYHDGNTEIAHRYLNRPNGLLFIDDIAEGPYPDDTWNMSEHQVIEGMAQVVLKMGMSLSSSRKPSD